MIYFNDSLLKLSFEFEVENSIGYIKDRCNGISVFAIEKMNETAGGYKGK